MKIKGKLYLFYDRRYLTLTLTTKLFDEIIKKTNMNMCISFMALTKYWICTHQRNICTKWPQGRFKITTI